MEDFLRDWSYLGVFLGIVATGLGFPMPEELPVVIGGALSGTNHARWYIMLPVSIVAVVIGDFFLYGIGRVWGSKLVERPFVKKRLLPPERLESIRQNFQQYGVRILLFARMTPGIRAPIFLTAGITHLPLSQFLMADGLYAIPGVSLLFVLGYYFTEGMVNFFKEEAEKVKSVIIIVVVLAVAGYFLYKFFRKPVVTGDPKEVPRIVEPMQSTLEQVTEKIILPQQSQPKEAVQEKP